MLISSVNFKVADAILADEAVSLSQMNNALPDDLFFDIFWNNPTIIQHNGLYNIAYSHNNFSDDLNQTTNTLSQLLQGGNNYFAGHPIPSNSTLNKVNITFRHVGNTESPPHGFKLGILKYTRIQNTYYTSNDVASTKRIAELEFPAMAYPNTGNLEYTTVDFDLEGGSLIPLQKGDLMSFYMIGNGADSSSTTYYNLFITFTFKRT